MLPRDGDGKEEILSSRSHGRRTLARKIFFHAVSIVHRFHNFVCIDPNFVLTFIFLYFESKSI
jgi:hypothetical protein